MTSISVAGPVDAEAIPLIMRASARWVLWRYESRHEAWTKVPYVATESGCKASSTNPTTWRTFAEAFDAYTDGKADGIGFVLGDDFTGVDLDDCRDPSSGRVASWAQRIVEDINSYTEISPSAEGLKVFARGVIEKGVRKRMHDGEVEIYGAGRYFTVTGYHLAGTAVTLEDRTTELAALCLRLTSANGDRRAHRRLSVPPRDLDDRALLERARTAPNGETFARLWSGDTSRYGGDDSAADLALCNLLAFWCDGDAACVDRLFRQSGLIREKWDERRGAETYGAITIAKAIAGRRETYRPTSTYTPATDSKDAGNVRADDRLTEAGAAERFARLHSDAVRFDYRRDRWLMWPGHRWMPDADAAVTRLALDFARTWQREAIGIPDHQTREAVVRFALRLERRDALYNMLALARALKPIADAGDQWDSDPWLLGVPNGVVDLRTGQLRVGAPGHRITMNTCAPYDFEASCPRWERFVSEIFNVDADLTGFIHRAIGYSITGNTSEQCLFLCYGTGANGKGTFANTLMRVLGDYAWNMPFATIEMRDRASIPNDLAALVSRRFVTASETNDGTRLNESRVKALTGCDPVTARFLHGEFFTFEPVAKLWLSVNHKPIVRDNSFGFWRRLRLIPFTQTFPINSDLAEELRAEATGILTWCVRGCLAWQREGLSPPASVMAATREYATDSDPLASFLDEACELDNNAQVGASELYAHYKEWAERHGFTERERLTITMFGRMMSERFTREHASSGNVYKGLARKPL